MQGLLGCKVGSRVALGRATGRQTATEAERLRGVRASVPQGSPRAEPGIPHQGSWSWQGSGGRDGPGVKEMSGQKADSKAGTPGCGGRRLTLGGREGWRGRRPGAGSCPMRSASEARRSRLRRLPPPHRPAAEPLRGDSGQEETHACTPWCPTPPARQAGGPGPQVPGVARAGRLPPRERRPLSRHDSSQPAARLPARLPFPGPRRPPRGRCAPQPHPALPSAADRASGAGERGAQGREGEQGRAREERGKVRSLGWGRGKEERGGGRQEEQARRVKGKKREPEGQEDVGGGGRRIASLRVSWAQPSPRGNVEM